MKRPTSKRAPTIVEAMDGIFAPWFRGASWDPWRAVLKATAALPMTDEEISFFRSVAGRREPPSRRPREAWYMIGRRGGKDSATSLIAAHAAATFNPKGILRPGERAVVACIAPDKETGKIIHGMIKAFFDLVPQLKGMIRRETEDLFELSNSVDVVILTSNFRSVRGRPILCCVFDEVALMRGDDSAASDVELYSAVTPGMATIPQAQLFGISSPYAKSGLLYKKFVDKFGKDDDDVLVIQAPSHVMNPTLDTRDRDRMMLEDPARARAEWYAEPRSDLIAFIDPEVVSRCVVEDRAELLPVPGVQYVAAIDPSGGSSDSMTLAIAHAEGERTILDLVREWPAPFSPEAVVLEACEALRRFSVGSVTGDRYSGEWARERFRVHGIDYNVAAWTRSEAYLDMLPLINSSRVELLDNRRLVSQLCSLERRTARSGKDSVDHPRGGKDDLINAAALAIVAAALISRGHADNWIEYLRRELQRGEVDVDDVRASGPRFGFSFNAAHPEKVFDVVLPPSITSGTIEVNGRSHITRYRDGGGFIEAKCEDAVFLLSISPVWREANAALAAELLSNEANA